MAKPFVTTASCFPPEQIPGTVKTAEKTSWKIGDFTVIANSIRESRVLRIFVAY
jgi:hypothetical protein